MDDVRYERLRRALVFACLFFALLGLTLALLGRSPLFQLWSDQAAAAVLLRKGFPEHLVPFASLLDGILGASIFGKWIAALFLALEPLRRREAWAWRASMAGLLAWFVVDSTASVLVGAAFNVAMINLFPLLLVGGLLLAMRRGAHAARAKAKLGAGHFVQLCVLMGLALFGLFIAFGSGTPLFGLWTVPAANALFHSDALARDARQWLAFVGGPIGGTVFGQATLLFWIERHAGARGEAWAGRAVAASLLGWFVVDSGLSAARGGLFNVLLANLPSLVIFAVGFAAARLTRPRPAAGG